MEKRESLCWVPWVSLKLQRTEDRAHRGCQNPKKTFTIKSCYLNSGDRSLVMIAGCYPVVVNPERCRPAVFSL